MTVKMSFRRKLKRALRRAAKIIRILSVAPVPALVLFIVLYASGQITTPVEFICATLTISVLPLLAYPLQPMIPFFRDKGREGQRTLAMIMSTLGYIIGVVLAFALDFGRPITTVLVTYLLSGVTLMIINKVFHFRASGHGCGLAGPMGVIAYYTGPAGIALSIGVFFLVLWSSLKLHSHTVSQYVVGALIPNVIFYSIILFL